MVTDLFLEVNEVVLGRASEASQVNPILTIESALI